MTDRDEAAATRLTRTEARAAALPNAGPAGDWNAGDSIQLDLSGGGIRAGLCSIGMVYWLRYNGDWRDVRRIVSVSGGSLVNARLALDRPADDVALTSVLNDLYRAFTDRKRIAAIGGALGGCVALLLIAAFADAGHIERASWSIAPIVVVWLVLLWVVRVVYTPIVLLVACFVIAWVEVPRRWEWIALGIALVAVPGVALAVTAAVRTRQLDLPWKPVRAEGESTTRYLRRMLAGRLRVNSRGLGLVGFAQVGGLVLLVALATVDASVGHRIEAGLWRGALDALRGAGWAILAYGAVQGVILPLIVRQHFARMLRLRRVEATPPPVDGLRTLLDLGGRAGDGWDVCHAICAADIREDAANFFILAPNGQRVLATEAVSPNVPPRLVDATDVPIPTAMQASSAFIPTLQPVIPLSTRRHPLADESWALPLRIQVLLDGGIHGTLGTQFEVLGVGRERRWDFLAQEPHDRRLVLDAARYRSSPAFWPLTLVPKFGGQVAQLRVMQMLLRGVVRAERDRASGTPTRYIRATGAAMEPEFRTQGSETPTPAEIEIAKLHRIVNEMRTWVDATGSWWPSRAQGLRCIAATYAAAFQELRFPQGATLDELRSDLEALEEYFGRSGTLPLDELFEGPSPAGD